jgi:antitoxin VapB
MCFADVNLFAISVGVAKMGYVIGISKGVVMERGSVFQSNRSQAVRLPKAAALPDDVKRVDVIAIGRTRIITPAGEAWDSWFDGVGVTADFMVERDQPPGQERDEL